MYLAHICLFSKFTLKNEMPVLQVLFGPYVQITVI